MGTKISNTTKQLALEKLRQGMTIKEVADMTGISERSAKRFKASLSAKTAPPSGSAGASHQSQEKQGQVTQTGNDDKTALDFEASPEPVEKKGVVDSALSSLKGMLGMADKKEDKAAPPVLSAKLDAKRQQFVDSASPTLALAFMALASWLWGRIGPEYSQLAPDDKVAQRIVEPLLRVYARHANFMTDVNPDVADIGASMFALVGYVHVSLGLYQQIKQEKEEYEQGNQNGSYPREYRAARPVGPENGTSNESRGYADVQRPGGEHGASNGSNGGYQPSVDIPTLPDKEARQYAALSRLSQLDYQSRARRSGRA